MSTPQELSVGGGAAERSRWGHVLYEEDWRESMEELAGSYYYCVYAWWRRDGLAPAEAGEATVATFSRWLMERRPMLMDSGAKSMREWVPARLAELERDGIDWEGEPALRIDAVWAEQRYEDEPPGEPDAIFNRRWGLTVLEFSVQTLRAEYAARGEEEAFPELLPFAGYVQDEEDRYSAAAARLGVTRGAMRKLVYDFRHRQRELLLDFIGDTLSDPAAAEQEVTSLLIACDLPGGGSSAARLPSAIGNLHPDQMLSRAMKSVRMTGGASGFWKPPSTEEAARLFPQYEVSALIGRGGMGAVYQGRQKELDRPVAIKLLPLEVSVDRSFAERFRREARAMAKLQHPNIVDVHDFGTTSEGHLYFVMEYVEGANLEQMIKGPGLEPAQALEIIGSVCEALAYAHAEGVVHRDIKPANVMVSLKGQVKVADFGLARLTEPQLEPRGYTVTGTVLGTPDYMAPEQKRGQTVDHRADIYSLGVMLYEMLCREVPQGIFDPPSKRVAVDTRVDEVVMKAMQQQPEKRFQSSTEMQTAVTRARAPQPLVTVPRGNLAPARIQRARLVEPKRKSPVFTLLFLAALGTAGFLWYAQYGKKMIAPAASATPGPASIPGIATATKEAPFLNSLGMRFVPVPIVGGPTAGQRMLFSVWDTRVQDYAVFAKDTNREWPQPDFEQGPTHPATCVSWNDAVAFCTWLTERERKAGRLGSREEVRLPSDHEWSCAVGIGELEDAAKSPAEKSRVIRDVYPWGGTEWPPPDHTANYSSEELKGLLAAGKAAGARIPVEAYRDGFGATSPVGSYAANDFGLFDMGGNVWQWCADAMSASSGDRVIRGAHWGDAGSTALSSCRWGRPPTRRDRTDGFRCVIAPVAENVARPVVPVLSQKSATSPASPPPALERREDLLAPLTPEALATTTKGWRIDNLRLLGPPDNTSAIPLRRSLNDANYRLRLRLGRMDLVPVAFVVTLPVGDRGLHFFLDGWPERNFCSGFDGVDGGRVYDAPNSVHGQQIRDTRTRELVLAVRTEGASTTIEAQLDGRVLCRWSGLTTAVPPAVGNFTPGALSLQMMGNNRGGGWFVREAQLFLPSPSTPPSQNLLSTSTPAAKPMPEAVPGPWEDVLAGLTPEGVAQTGNGWRLEAGELRSPPKGFAIVPLPGQFAGTGYDLRIKLRQVKPVQGFYVGLPVGDRMVGFEMDGYFGRYTGLSAVAGKVGATLPGVVEGKQVQDAAAHLLEVAVRFGGPDATVATALDGRPLYQWSGPAKDLALFSNWRAAPVAALSLGAHADDWAVSEVKVKRLTATPGAAAPVSHSAPAGAWVDLLAGLTPEVLAKSGRGWRRDEGGLRTPATGHRSLALPGDYANTTYQLRLKLRALKLGDLFHVVVPVGDRNVGFQLDGYSGKYTGLQRVGGKKGGQVPGVVEGRQVNDTLPHDLELSVRLRGANATFTSMLDGRPLYHWNGPIASLNEDPPWTEIPTGTIGIACWEDNWLVLEAKAMRVVIPDSLPETAPAAASPALSSAAALTNSLGMQFVPVPIVGGPTAGQRILFSVWDTRVQDYEVFVKETKREWLRTDFEQGPTHPVADASWEDAQAFCNWLTAREQKAGKLPATEAYRLPSDHEWSCAVGIGDREDPAKLPQEKSGKVAGAYPWGAAWPPPPNAGNFGGEELQQLLAAGKFPRLSETIAGYRDGFPTTSPVGSFQANRYGLYDMAGNVWQFCEDWGDQPKHTRVLRGGCWASTAAERVLSSDRYFRPPNDRVGAMLVYTSGFRCVLGPKPAPPKPATEIERWFTQIDEPQEEAYEKQVAQPFESALAELRAHYLAALDAALVKASGAGQLSDALSYRNERKYFAEEENVPRLDAGVHPAVLALRATFRQQLLKLEQTRLAAAKTVFMPYDGALEKNQALLTKTQRLDEALFVKAKRAELAKRWLAPCPLVEVSGAAAAEKAAASAQGPAPITATKENPYVNQLEMKFVPLPGRTGAAGGERVLISVWDTRVEDYQAFVDETRRGWGKPGFEQGPTHPAVNMSWLDAQAFCAWLTDKEQKAGKIGPKDTYRLPSDQEWSRAVGLPAEQGATPAERAEKNQADYPWGRTFPPKTRVGNYRDESFQKIKATDHYVVGYDDGFVYTAPVGSFAANRLGLYDMGGNVWQWCDDWFDKSQNTRVTRGGSFEGNGDRKCLLSAYRESRPPGSTMTDHGFRCVLGIGAK